MNHISAREARNHFAELIDNAQHEPVSIERHGRPVAVLMSAREYEKIMTEKLRARFAISEAQLDNGEGIQQTARDVVEEHKQQMKNG